MVIETQLFESGGTFALFVALDEVYKRKVYAQDELFARILDAAVGINKREVIRR
jgi:hypothetical protein